MALFNWSLTNMRGALVERRILRKDGGVVKRDFFIIRGEEGRVKRAFVNSPYS